PMSRRSLPTRRSSDLLLEQAINRVGIALEEPSEVGLDGFNCHARHQLAIEDDSVLGGLHGTSLYWVSAKPKTPPMPQQATCVSPGLAVCRVSATSRCRQRRQRRQNGLTTTRMTMASRTSTGTSLNQR